MSEERRERTRKYREAAEAFLGGPVEAAGYFRRPQGIGNDPENRVRLLISGYERLTKGRVRRLHGRFLLAVTNETVHAFEFRGKPQGAMEASPETVKVRREIATFDRGEIRLRAVASGHLYLDATEGKVTRQIKLDGDYVELSPGAAEVVALRSN